VLPACTQQRQGLSLQLQTRMLSFRSALVACCCRLLDLTPSLSISAAQLRPAWATGSTYSARRLTSDPAPPKRHHLYTEHPTPTSCDVALPTLWQVIALEVAHRGVSRQRCLCQNVFANEWKACNRRHTATYPEAALRHVVRPDRSPSMPTAQRTGRSTGAQLQRSVSSCGISSLRTAVRRSFWCTGTRLRPHSIGTMVAHAQKLLGILRLPLQHAPCRTNAWGFGSEISTAVRAFATAINEDRVFLLDNHPGVQLQPLLPSQWPKASCRTTANCPACQFTLMVDIGLCVQGHSQQIPSALMLVRQLLTHAISSGLAAAAFRTLTWARRLL
jgi:hypothetical protein